MSNWKEAEAPTNENSFSDETLGSYLHVQISCLIFVYPEHKPGEENYCLVPGCICIRQSLKYNRHQVDIY